MRTSILWLAVAVLTAAAFFATGRRLAFGVFTVCRFTALHLWKSANLRPRGLQRGWELSSLPAEARGIVASEPRVFSAGNSSFEIRVSQLRLEASRDSRRLSCFKLNGQDRHQPMATKFCCVAR